LTVQKVKGIEFERKVKSHLKSKGYEAFRVAASLGPVDVIAIRRGEILLVECTTDPRKIKEKKEKLMVLRQILGDDTKVRVALASQWKGRIILREIRAEPPTNGNPKEATGIKIRRVEVEKITIRTEGEE